MKFRATIEGSGKTAAGFRVPEDVLESLGKGKRPPVRVTINGFTYRSTVAPMGGVYMIGVSAENRAGAGVAAGDDVEVQLELDTAPREVAVPPDLQKALDAAPDAKRFFEGLAYSDRRWFVLGVEGAKTQETRDRRVEKAIERLREGRGAR